MAVRKSLPPDMPVIVKINVNDFAPTDGVKPELSKKYCAWLAELKVDGLEISCSLPVYSFMNMVRGDVPVRELTRAFPLWKRPVAWVMTKRLEGTLDFISMARPFIREPDLVKRFKQGKAVAASCVSCNQCFAAMMNKLSLRCYNKNR